MVKDNDLFVQEGRHAGKSGVAGMQWWMPNSLRLFANNMLLKDEPDHRRLRKLVDKAFQRRDVQAMRSRIEQIADRLLDALDGQDEVDLASQYARRLPLDVICELLGLPHQDRATFAEWTRAMLSIQGPWSIARAPLCPFSRFADRGAGQTRMDRALGHSRREEPAREAQRAARETCCLNGRQERRSIGVGVPQTFPGRSMAAIDVASLARVPSRAPQFGRCRKPHRSASGRVSEGPAQCRFVWATDLQADELANDIDSQLAEGDEGSVGTRLTHRLVGGLAPL